MKLLVNFLFFPIFNSFSLMFYLLMSPIFVKYIFMLLIIDLHFIHLSLKNSYNLIFQLTSFWHFNKVITSSSNRFMRCTILDRQMYSFKVQRITFLQMDKTISFPKDQPSYLESDALLCIYVCNILFSHKFIQYSSRYKYRENTRSTDITAR